MDSGKVPKPDLAFGLIDCPVMVYVARTVEFMPKHSGFCGHRSGVIYFWIALTGH